jgi:hypothetical protein
MDIYEVCYNALGTMCEACGDLGIRVTAKIAFACRNRPLERVSSCFKDSTSGKDTVNAWVDTIGP